MKKIFSTIFLATVLTMTALANDPPSADPNCVYGHIETPGYHCEPPQRAVAGDDSTFAYINTLIGEYNPFVYFLN